MKRLLLIAALAGFCSAAAAQEMTITDRNGRTITLDGVPERVVCLLNRCAEELAAIGAPVPLAFAAPWTYNVALNPDNYGEAAADAIQIPSEPLDLEAVAVLEPDLIITMERDVAGLEAIAPSYTLSWDDRDSNDAWFYDARAYGRMLGMADQVEAQIQRITDKVAAYAALSPKDRTVAVINLTGEDQYYLVSNCDFFMRQWTECLVEPGEGEIETNIEFLLELDPDVIVIEDYNVGVDARGVGRDERFLAAQAGKPLWEALTAVQNGEVYLIPVSSAKPNSLGSIETTVDTLMPLIYPDTFPAPLTEAQIAEALSN